jgi:hypothetical protein
MARDGSGNYTNPYPDFVSGTVISSSETDANNSAIATALTQSIAVDGQSVVTADIPMASNKFTGLANGSAATDSATLGQVQAQAYAWAGTAAGSADALTASPTPAITAYAAGQAFRFVAASNNTGAATIAVSGLVAKAIQNDGSALAAADIATGKIYEVVYDGTQFQLSRVRIPPTALVAADIGVTVQAYDAQLSSLVRQNSQSAAYTTVLTDGGKHILHPSADTTARVFTIDSNANVAYPLGTAITFVNQASAGVVSIAITSDTMRLAGAGTTGTRTLAANGLATALKVTTTEWIISGSGLT